MKIELTINIGNYENIKIQSNDYKTGDSKWDLIECEKELLFILNQYKLIRKEIESHINDHEKIIQNLIK